LLLVFGTLKYSANLYLVSNGQFDGENQISDRGRWDLLQRKVQEIRVLQAFALFRENNIEPVLIKGFAAGRYYPDSVPRLSIDIDFAVAAADHEAALGVCRSLAADGLAIDLHNELRHLDTVAWSDLFDNSRLIHLDAGTIRVLRPEDHLRVLCVHWLTDGGTNKARLWDIYYLIANREADFDWDRFLAPVSERRQRWLLCTVGLAQRYLGLDLDDAPIKDQVGDLPGWLIKTVEREWATETKAQPLETVIYDRKKLVKQIWKRMHPNPIWATVQMEGSFDAKTRFFYKIGNTFKRIMPSISRISNTLRGRPHNSG